MAKDKEVNVLDELHKGACMGADAIYFIIDKIDDKKFKEVLKKEYVSYILNIVIRNHMKQVI